MDDVDRNQIVRIIKALEEGWTLVDDDQNHDFMVLVNESREELEGLRPEKALVFEMEACGLIVDPEQGLSYEERSGFYYRKDGSDGEWRIVPGPVVYLFEVADKGKGLINDAPG